MCLAKVSVECRMAQNLLRYIVPERTKDILVYKQHILGFSQSYLLFLYVKYRREVKNGRDIYDIGYCDHFAHSCMFYWKSGSSQGHKRIPYTLWAVERI